MKGLIWFGQLWARYATFRHAREFSRRTFMR